MAICPFATWRPVPSYGGSLDSVVGVVIHVTDGEGDPYNEFINPSNQVSSHFGIGNGQGGMADGALEQYVDTDNESWAQMAGNATYISVETEGVPTDPLTTAQLQTFGKLMAWINQEYRVPLIITDSVGSPGLITHGDGGVQWGNHPDCPGPLRSAQRADILEIAASIVNPPPAPSYMNNMSAGVPTDGILATRSDGGVFCYLGAQYYGSLPGSDIVPNAATVGIASTPSGRGYWIACSDGGVFSYGDAGFHGSMGGVKLNAPVVGITSTLTGNGYWLVAADGGIFAFGDAGFYGSMGGQHLNKPVVDMARSASGNGYWLVAEDGGVFAFGDAGFYGSTGSITLNKPIIGIAATKTGAGYWFVASDGGIFAFGDAAYHGSAPANPEWGIGTLSNPVVGIATDYSHDNGYVMVADKGSVNAPSPAIYACNETTNYS